MGPVFTSSPMEQEIMIGNSFTLEFIAEGFPRPSIQWYHNDTMITDSNNINDDTSVTNSISSTLTVMKANSRHSGGYFCQAQSSSVVKSDVVNVTVVGEYNMPDHMLTVLHIVISKCFNNPQRLIQ